MKAMLIVDMPKSCEDCELCRDGYLCLRLGEVDESVENGTKDLRCPLKPMPNEREEKDHYDFGWNDCIRVLNDDYNLCKLG